MTLNQKHKVLSKSPINIAPYLAVERLKKMEKF